MTTAASCDRSHFAPSCADPECYREELARKAEEFLPGLGTLVRAGRLDPDLPTSPKTSTAGEEHWREGPAKILHQELSDAEIDTVSLDYLRAAYRSLRAHHIEETASLISRRDDLTRRRDDILARDQEVLAQSQRLLEQANAFMLRDEATIDHLTSEVIALTRDRYTTAMLLAPRPADPSAPAYLSDVELASWLTQVDVKQLEGTYLRLVLDELRERRDAEAMFGDVDLQLQRFAECEECADDMHATDHEHRAILKRWKIAQAALGALARIHRGYLHSLVAKDPTR